MPPLIVLGLAWLGGMAWVGLWDAPWWLPGLTVVLLLPVALTRDMGVRPWLVVVAAMTATLGAWRFDDAGERQPTTLVALVGKEVRLTGTVASLPDPGLTTTRYELAAETADDRPTIGSVLLTVGEYTEWPLGTRLAVAGELDEAPTFPDFDYRGHLARQGIVGTMLFPEVKVLSKAPWSIERVIGESRLALESELQRALPEPEASLAAGIALGLDGNLPPELYDDYRRTGLAHIIAVSGSNVALLTGIVFVLLVPLLGRTTAIGPAAAMVIVYVLLAGAEASVVRAGIMAGVFLLGLALGRQQSGLAALAAAAIVMTAWSPSAAQAVGFQLSLAATAGLIVFGPWIAWGLERISPVRARAMLPRGLYLVASWTLASTIATAPLLWLNFGELSTVGVIANLLVEPAFALALGLSLVTAVAGLAWEPLGWIAGTAAWYPLALMNRVAETLSSRQWASVEAGGATGTRAALAYFVLIAVGAAAFRFPPPALEDAQNGGARVMRRYSLAAVAGSLVVAVAWFSVRPAGGPGDLIITFLDVGQGDAVLITTPNGRQILVDGGASGIGVAQEIGAVMPHWDRRLDYVVLTHPQQDHMAGLVEVGRRFDVGVVIESGATNTTEAFELYTSEFRERETWRAGQATTIDGVEIAVLWPPAGRFEYELNNTSLVLRLEYGGTILLLTGDIQSEAQEAMLASGAAIDADVLKVPHHGAATSTEAFFDAVSADLAIISAGAGNRFGHPLDETIEALAPATVVRTDERGRVTVVVAEDGRVTYRTER